MLKQHSPPLVSAVSNWCAMWLSDSGTQCVMMNTIYKLYKGSELGDVLMAGGVVAEGSVGFR